jgi:hypothetical protein
MVSSLVLSEPHKRCTLDILSSGSPRAPSPKPKSTGPMDKCRDLSDKRVEAAVNRAVKSITDNPTDWEITERDSRPTASTSPLGAARKRHTAGLDEHQERALTAVLEFEQDEAAMEFRA